ncbi:type IV pilus secretin PilQ [Comamonadaceae bacterium M7527]|nr:type IV pilus secretin PilQ [Comamonadaceae bacterium M7527]
MLGLAACQTRPNAGDQALIDVASQREQAQQSVKALSAQALPPVAAPTVDSTLAKVVPPESAYALKPDAPRSETTALPDQEPKLTLDVTNAPIQSVLQAIAQVAGVNLVLADGVKGQVSVQLQDVAWRAALQALLRANDLGMSQAGDVMWVAPRVQILAERRQRLQAQLADIALVPLQTKAYQMNYAKAVDVAAYLTGSKTRTSVSKAKDSPDALLANAQQQDQGLGLTGVLSSRGSVMPEPRTNQLFVSDVPSSLVRVAELIAHIDVPVRQVLIEARIVEADDSFSQELGARLGGGVVPSVGVGPVRGVIGPSFDAVSGQLGGGTTPFVNLPSAGVGGYPAANFAVSLFTPDATRFINLELSALEADGRGVIVSRPSIVTADQVKALIEQGTEYPYQSTTSNGGSSVMFRRATLRLAVVPHITPHGQVMLSVDINKDSRGETTAQGVAINTKHVQTQVLVDNAGTAVIGGIFERYDRNADTKVPLLGDLPGLGVLFRNRSSRSDKSEMLVFLTPHILQAPRTKRETISTLGGYGRGGSVN